MNDITSPLSTSDRRVPPDVPGFDLIRPIGKGGFGEVWLASNRATGRLRALKIIAAARSGTVDAAGREITSIIRLEANLHRQHPNLVNIHHVGECPGHIFLVMDLADDLTGTPGSADPGYRPATLQSRLQAGPMPAEECRRRAGELLAGLAALHDSGMVHRDVKPANCLFVGGELQLADFGLLTEVDRQMSRVGTESYMPPDGRMDARADVFAAGLTVYEMLTGLPAACFPSLGEHAEKFADDPILQRLNRLVLRACQTAPHARYENAREMLGELTHAQRNEARWSFRHGGWIGVCVACVLLAIFSAIFHRWTSQGERVRVNFVTEPFEATIQLDGVLLLKPDGTPYTTPCTIPELPTGSHHVVFQHPAMPDLDVGWVDFRDSRDIDVRWNVKPIQDITPAEK
ncbi:MAG: serine/threonine-protein kinase [Thermoguttaceae bacterium]